MPGVSKDEFFKYANFVLFTHLLKCNVYILIKEYMRWTTSYCPEVFWKADALTRHHCLLIVHPIPVAMVAYVQK